MNIADSKRLAFTCNHREHEKDAAVLRVFALPDDPVPECPKHGKMTLQANTPYRGQAIPAS